jgi:hypothetical protein
MTLPLLQQPGGQSQGQDWAMGAAGWIWPGMTAAQINGVIAGAAVSATRAKPGVIYGPAGTYPLDAKLVGKSHVHVCPLGEGGRIVWDCQYAAAGGDVDTSTNTLVDVLGALDLATFNGTVGVTVVQNTTACTLAGSGGAPANNALLGKYLVLEGNNLADPGPFADNLDGAAVTQALIVKIASNVGYAAVLSNLALMRRAAANTAKAVIPIVNFRMYRCTFNASGGSIAVGALMRYAIDCQLIDCEFIGFTRAPWEMDKGSIGCKVTGRSLGENSSMGIVNSAHHAFVDFDQVPDVAARYSAAANSVIRGGFVLWNRPVNPVIKSRLHDGTIGLIARGARVGVVDITCYNMLPDAAYDSLVTAGELTAAARCGVLNANLGIAGTAEVCWRMTWKLKVVGYTTAKAQPTVVGIRMNQDYDAEGEAKVECPSTSATSPKTGGVWFSNADGKWATHTAGVSYGVGAENYVGLEIEHNFEGDTDGTGADYASYLNHTSGSIVFKKFNAANLAGATVYVFIGSIPAACYNGIRFMDMNLNGLRFVGLGMLHYSPAIAAGDVMVYDQTDDNDYRLVKTPAADGEVDNVIMATLIASGGYCIGFLPQSSSLLSINTNGATHHGDVLRSTNGQKYATVDNAATGAKILGRVLESKGAGAAVKLAHN